jgi:hypothetical protein
MITHACCVIGAAALVFATASAASAQPSEGRLRTNHPDNRRSRPDEGVVVTSLPCPSGDCRQTFGSYEGRSISPELYFDSASTLLSTIRSIPPSNSTPLFGGLIGSNCLGPRDQSTEELLLRTWPIRIVTFPYQPIRTDQVQFPFGVWRMTFIATVSGPRPMSQCFTVERIR